MFEFISKFFGPQRGFGLRESKKTETINHENVESQEKYWFEVYDSRWCNMHSKRIIARSHEEAATKYVDSSFDNTYEQIHKIIKCEKLEPYKKL